MSIYQGQITGSLKVQSSLTGLLYATSGVVSTVAFGAANGVATLDSNGRLPIGQLSVSAMEIKGDWDASLNSPSLSNGTGNMGDVYRCSVAGSVNFGAGSVTFIVGDLVYYTGSVWQIVANSFNLTTSGASGSASLTGRTLNIPTYTLSGLGGTPSSRSLTINGTAYDLSADRSWNIPSSPQARNVTTQTATLNQQVFTVSYTSGQIDVYYNGAYLAPSDYTATNGTSVTLAFQCKAGDVLVFAAYTNTLTIGGAGSTNYMAKWSSSSLLTSSTILYDTGSLLFVNKSTDNGSGAVLQVNGYITQSTTSTLLKADSNGKIVAATSGDFSGFGFLTGTGTTNTLTKYTGTSTIGNSNISDNGSLITFASNSYISGALGIGTSSLTGITLAIGKNITGAVTSYGAFQTGLVLSDVTTSARYYATSASTTANTFTLTDLVHYYSGQGTFGAGSNVTNQYGFFAQSTLQSATNNYGFYGNIAAAANRWNLYMNGTANNYLAGSLGIDSTSLTGKNLSVSKNITGQYIFSGGSYGAGIISDGQIQSDEVGGTSYYVSKSSTSASTFTSALIAHYDATQGTFGSGSTVTSQVGFYAQSTLIGATSNFGFYGNIASGTNRWNLYMPGTAYNHMQGSLGLGTTTIGSQYRINIGGSITGAVTAYGISNSGTIASDVTAGYNAYISGASTAAASFTLTSYYHFRAYQNTIGSGSTVTNQYGFYADATMTGATNNYGFFGNIAAATGRYNLYMSGDADNFMFGRLGIGASASASANVSLRLRKTITGGVTSYGMLNDGIVQNDVTTSAFYFSTSAQTLASSFTLGSLYHYNATQSTIGSTSAITNQFGFVANSNMIGATNNYGFYGNIPVSGTANWNLYMAGTAANYMAGSLGIGSTSLTNYSLVVGKNITGATGAYGITSNGTVQSDVAGARYYSTTASTQATTFTLSSLFHYQASQGTFGAGSTITTQYGFYATSNISGATNNYGLYSDIVASGTANWNIYANGAAPNYMNGSLGIGSTSLTGYNIRMQKSITGNVTAYGMMIESAIQSDVTSNAIGYSTNLSTQATTFTAANITHYQALQSTIGAGSTVTNQYGFNVSSNLIGATNNYGFYGNIASGTNRWNLYMAGTAQNYLAGNTGIGVAATTTAELSLGAGTTAQAQINLAASTAPTSPVNGDIWFDGTNLKIRVGGVTKTVTII